MFSSIPSNFLLFLGVFLISSSNAGSVSTRQAAVNRAIEQTKSRQNSGPMFAGPQRVPQRANVRLNGEQPTTSSPGKSETIDVEKLNRLIRSIDKTWILPKTGSKDPVGSNFQYKKTCASIFKARHGACQQLGFGVMCFNYCHERGEKLSFKCQDSSDASYCKQSGTFDTFLAKYRKDGYKAKAYIHQMISRCYATTICNSQSGILNSTLIDEEPEVVEKTTKPNRMRLLTKKPGNHSPLTLMKLKTRRVPSTTTTTILTTTIIPALPDEGEEDQNGYESAEEVTTKKVKVLKKKTNNSLRTRPTSPPEMSTTTTKSNIWDKFTIGNKARPTPKYIPFWQRLMSTTVKPTEDEAEEVIDEEPEEETSLVGAEKSSENRNVDKISEPTSTAFIETGTVPEEDIVVTSSKVHKTNGETSEPRKLMTFKSIPVTVPSIGPELAHQKPNENGLEGGPGFWNRFQPNRWFESIHYVTNTGK